MVSLVMWVCLQPVRWVTPPPLSSDLPKAAIRILSNVTFLFVSLSYTAESAIVTAFITFIPKFIESQFGIPASNASIYTGTHTHAHIHTLLPVFFL